MTGDDTTVAESYGKILESYGRLPSGLASLAPLVVPIILMALSSVSAMAGWNGQLAEICAFLGAPIIALAVGAILAIGLLFSAGKKESFYNLTNDTLKTVGPILLVTAAGGVLGKVIASSDLVAFITEHAAIMQKLGISFPFLLAAVLKSAHGLHYARRSGPGSNGNWRRSNDCLPRQRFLFLGSNKLRRIDPFRRLQVPHHHDTGNRPCRHGGNPTAQFPSLKTILQLYPIL